MFNKTPITIVPPGYKPDLDRLPPSSGGCSKALLWAFALLIIVGGIGVGGFIFLRPRDSEIMPTLIPSELIIYTDTPQPINYCWYLTPTIEIIPVTPDSWGLMGTETALQTGTPARPTSEPPRELCDSPGWQTSEPTAYFTPRGIPSDVPHYEIGTATDVPTPTAIPTDVPTAIPTATLFPTLAPHDGAGTGGSITTAGGSSAPPQVIYQDVIVIQTVVKVKKVNVVVTATPSPSPTIEIESTEEASPIPTATATDVPTATIVPTSTPSPTATATDVPTATLIPTSTLFPTLEGSSDA